MNPTSTTATTPTPQAKVIIERTYRARIDDLWEL
jgi:hypothetical protein